MTLARLFLLIAGLGFVLFTSASSPDFDVDGDGSASAFTDGILILRDLFGFEGDSLVRNAVGAGATRTQPQEIGEFLNQNRAEFDLDSDRDTKALTDGLLTLRLPQIP